MKQKIQKIIHASRFFLIIFFTFSCLGISPAKASTPSDVYRFWSDTKQGHFYTASADEKAYIETHYPSNIWKYEGIAFQVFATPEPGTVPVYRFWSDTKQGHFYTASEDEKTM